MASSSIIRKKNAHSEQFDDESGLERLVFFSDAVFAIAVTLLALEIRLPEDAGGLSNLQLFKSLIAIWPKYLSFFISFLVIGNFWIAHHHRYRYIQRYDTRLMLLNLFAVNVDCLYPFFPTAVISENGNRLATVCYIHFQLICNGFIISITLAICLLEKPRLLKGTFNR